MAPKVTLGSATGGSPQATLGAATGSTPKVSFGQASGESAGVGAAAVPTVFRITELTGDKREIELSGRAAPYRPFKLEGKHRVESTPLAGFATKTQQALGAEEMPTTCNGTWKDMYLANSVLVSKDTRSTVSIEFEGVSISNTEVSSDFNAVTTAHEVAELIDDVRRKGQTLQVTWMHIARIGKLVNLKQAWLTSNDVEWEMEFDWSGRDEAFISPTPAQPNVSESVRQATQAYLSVQDATGFVGVPDLNTRFADAIDNHVSALQQGLLQVEDALKARIGAVTDSAEAIQRAIGTFAFVEDEADNLIGELTTRAAVTMVNVGADLDALSPGSASVLVASINPSAIDYRRVDPGQQVSAGIAVAKSLLAARQLRHACGRQRVKLQRSVEADVLAVVMCKEEQDLRDLSIEWYDTPDDWVRIRKFNGLSGSQVEPGQIVLIPALGVS